MTSRIERDLYLITRATVDDPWSTPVVVDGLETGGDESGPASSSDGLELYYEVDALNTTVPLCVATRDSVDEPFTRSAPVTEINALGSVGAPWISADGNTLFVSAYDLEANRWVVYAATR